MGERAMKTSLTKTLAALALGVCGVGFAQDAPAPTAESGNIAATKLGELTTKATALLKKSDAAPAVGLTFALFVGREVNENSPVRMPTFSKRDVASVEALLEKKNGLVERNAATMTSKEKAFYLKPKRENVLAMLRRVADEAREEDSIWVVFSGDGVSYEGDAAFLPQGASLDDPATWIFESEVREILAASPAKNVVAVWLTHRRTYKVENPTPRERRAIEPKEGAERVAIFACSSGESAWESQDRELDLFWSEFLSAAEATDEPLRGETLRRVFDAAAAKTSEATQNNKIGAQTPKWQNF